jgi:pSer/pThr/pTyr-binding forkhead associated (FHA) protein
VVEPSQRTGTFAIDARFREGPGGSGAGSLLLPSGERYVLREHKVVLGRLPDCDITLVDPNVSRQHAEIQPRGDGFVLVDLGSTNGSRVNGIRVAERELRDGDELGFGNIRLTFQAS